MTESAQTIAVTGRAVSDSMSCSQVVLVGCPTGCTASSIKFPDWNGYSLITLGEGETLSHHVVFYPDGGVKDVILRKEKERFFVDVKKMFVDKQREKRAKDLEDARTALQQMSLTSSIHTAAERTKQEKAVVAAQEAINEPLQEWGPLTRCLGAAWWNGSRLDEINAFYVLRRRGRGMVEVSLKP